MGFDVILAVSFPDLGGYGAKSAPVADSLLSDRWSSLAFPALVAMGVGRLLPRLTRNLGKKSRVDLSYFYELMAQDVGQAWVGSNTSICKFQVRQVLDVRGGFDFVGCCMPDLCPFWAISSWVISCGDYCAFECVLGLRFLGF